MTKILEKFEEGNGRWASTGTKDTIPTDLTLAKIAQGWVGGEDADRPAIDTFNKLQNRAEEKIDDVIENGPAANYPQLTEAEIQSQLTTGIYDNPWGSTNDTLNRMYGGADTKAYIDVTVAFTAAGEKRILALDESVNKIDVFDPETLTLVDTSDDLSDDLPSVGTEVWVPVAFCVDATSTHVYVLFKNTFPNPDEWQIQSYLISDWSANTGWAATGVASSDTGNGLGDIFIADSTHLCIVQEWVTINAATDDGLALHLLSDGTFVRGGGGDSPGGDPSEAQHACSDGTNIYFVSEGGGGDSYVCSATIADLEAGLGGNYPLTVTNSVKGRICNVGGFIASTHSVSTYAEGDFVFFTHSATDPDLQYFERGASQNGIDGKYFIMKRIQDIIYDGINIWILAKVENGAGANDDQQVLIKVDAAKLSITDTAAGSIVAMDDISSVFVVNAGGSTGVNDDEQIKGTFDGRDVWINIEPRASQTYSGYLYRLPLALLRH